MKKHIFVDGYNVIRSSGLYDRYEGEDHSGIESGLNAKREALVSDVAAFALGEYQDVAIVFDGGGNVASTGSVTKLGGVTVMFSRKGQTADSVIEKLVHDVRDSQDEILVVTSDALIQWTVLGDRVTRMSAANFADELRRIRTIGRDDADILVGSVKNTLAERISPDVAEKLRAMLEKGDND